MCLALIQKQNASKLSDAQIKTAFNNNNDGCGIAYVNNGYLRVKKYMNVNDAVIGYNDIYDSFNKKSHIMIHFRIGTHGAKSMYNVHPFMVNDKLAFCHNGIINRVQNCNKRSDTRVFNDEVLKFLPNRFIHNASIIKLISDFIGHSKLIFLNSDNQFKIVNEKMGHWVEKTWFSNSSYKSNVFDFGGYSKPTTNTAQQCKFSFNDFDDIDDSNIYYQKPKTKKTRYTLDKCEKCNVYTSKQHYDLNSSSWHYYLYLTLKI